MGAGLQALLWEPECREATPARMQPRCQGAVPGPTPPPCDTFLFNHRISMAPSWRVIALRLSAHMVRHPHLQPAKAEAGGKE